jgi:hypothetical protein
MFWADLLRLFKGARTVVLSGALHLQKTSRGRRHGSLH